MLKLSGIRGTITAGGRLAAHLLTWQHEGTETQSTTTAKASEINDFLLENASGLVLSLPVGRGRWAWRDVTVGRSGNDLTITGRGRPERRT